MNKIYLLALILLTIACSKKRKEIIKIGDVSDMIITDFNDYVEGIYVGLNQKNFQEKKYNVNHQPEMNFTIYSHVDTILNVNSDSPKYNFTIKIKSNSIALGVLKKSNLHNSTVNKDTIINGVNKAYTFKNYSFCESKGFNQYEYLAFVNTYTEGDEMSIEDKFDGDTGSFGDFKYIFKSKIETVEENTYTLKKTNKNYSCLNSPKNTLFYVGFKYENRLGWIEMEITGDNTIQLLRTAIQK